jgi:hypothetical protein
MSPLLTTLAGDALNAYGFTRDAPGDIEAFEHIATLNGTGSSSTITFSSIPQTFKHLQVRYVTKDDGNSTVPRPLDVRYNGQLSTYRSHILTGTGSTLYSETTTAMTIGYTPVLTGASNAFAAGIFDILDYADTNKTATFRNFSGYTNGSSGDSYPQTISQVAMTSGMRTTTTAITSLTFVTGWGNFVTQARFSLYGIKG